MDTDGHCMYSNNDNFVGTEFSTISKQLCDDIVEIVHTLGGVARIKTRIPTYIHKGVKMKGKLAYRVNIKLPLGMNPFRLKRKADRYKTPKKYPTGRYIKNIEKIGFEETVCISVDSPDKLYVTEHCIVTHNTTSTIIAALETGAKKILIICPASLKINWQREIANYTDRSVYIAEGKNFSLEHDFVIVNYDILKNFHELKGKTDSLITQFNPELIILDEAHYVSNGQAARTKLVNNFTSKVKYLWLLTGTPMTNRPMNYFNLLNLIENSTAQNWLAFAIRYCGGYQFTAGKKKIWNVQGATNLEELRERTSKQVLRRLKTDVLDLPDKIITPVYLKLNSKLYEGLMGEYFNWYNKNPEESKSLTIQFSKLMKVRQVIADEKIKNTIELAENIIEQGKKVIIFTNFTESLNKISDHFGKLSVKLDGSTSKPNRQHAVDQFQDNDKIKVFVGNTLAAGVGITLTAGEAVIMNDLSFVPGHLLQAEDRAYRYGQKNSVSIYYPLFINTVEMVIYDMVNEKKQNIDVVMGDNVDHGDIVQEIMRRINPI
jgi:SNF2 family DNA or RNA helicase